jgi:hypothetical protein
MGLGVEVPLGSETRAEAVSASSARTPEWHISSRNRARSLTWILDVGCAVDEGEGEEGGVEMTGVHMDEAQLRLQAQDGHPSHKAGTHSGRGAGSKKSGGKKGGGGRGQRGGFLGGSILR